MSLSLRFAATSDVGRVRRDNQDSGYAGPHLLVVADGVGGAARGDVASSATVDALRKLDVPAGNDALSELAATIQLAHDRLAEIVETHPDMDGTSTTVSAAVFDGSHLQVGHIGDSRAYLLRDGALSQITSDHSLVQSLVDEGRITEEEARVHPHRNLILKAVDSVHEPEPDLFAVPLEAGDRVLFCSDGCSGVLSTEQMAAMLGGRSLDTVTADLVLAALEAGSSDNVTVVVAEVVDGEVAPAPAVVVGAAASAPHLQIAADSRTGNLSDADLHVIKQATDPEAIRYAPLPPERRAWLRRLALLLLVLVIIGAAGFGGYRYTQTRYFVIAEGQRIAIYQGVNLDVPFVELSSLIRDSDYTLDDLGVEYAEKLADGVDRGSLEEIETYIDGAHCARVIADADDPPPSVLTTIPAAVHPFTFRRGPKVPVLNRYPVPAHVLISSEPDPELAACEQDR